MATQRRGLLLDANLTATGYGDAIDVEGLSGLCFVLRTVTGTTNLTAEIVGADDPDLADANWSTFQQFNDGDAITTGDDEYLILASVKDAPCPRYIRVKTTITSGAIDATKSFYIGHII